MRNKLWPERVNCKMWKDKNTYFARSRIYSNPKYSNYIKGGQF